MRRFWIFKIVVMVLAMFSLVSFILMSLWNWLMPVIFGLTTITFWQAAGILLLSKIIFGFGKGGGHHQHGPPWKRKWQEKWHNMSDDQREKWKQRFATKWCPGGLDDTKNANAKEAGQENI